MKCSVAVKGIIEKNNKILIVRRSDNKGHRPGVWETVGGRMDSKTNPENELKREIYEEVGLTVDIIQPFNIFHFICDTEDFVIGITYACKYVSGHVMLSDEHVDHQWIDPKEFDHFESVDSLKKEIELYTSTFMS
jgi:8-oxo-dGTP diphosphatase